jgi:hypothetical protein
MLSESSAFCKTKVEEAIHVNKQFDLMTFTQLSN